MPKNGAIRIWLSGEHRHTDFIILLAGKLRGYTDA
jgi:hypothetical protein